MPTPDKTTRRAPLSYRAAIDWMVLNDDTEWCLDANPSPSVTAALVADIYDRTTEEVTKDTRNHLLKQTRARMDEAYCRAKLAAMQGNAALVQTSKLEAEAHRKMLHKITDRLTELT